MTLAVDRAVKPQHKQTNIFHAVQRFTTIIQKRCVSSLRYNLFQDFILIFPDNNDEENSRTKLTPENLPF